MRAVVIAAPLSAGVLCAPSRAAADSRGGESHWHFTITLSSTTITEGESVTVSVNSPHTAKVFTGMNTDRHHSAVMSISKTGATPTASGAGAVNFGSNTQVSWTDYLDNRNANNLGDGKFNSPSSTVTISTVDDNAQTGHRTVTVSGSVDYRAGTYWYSHGDVTPTITSTTLTILDNDVPQIGLALGSSTIAESGADNATTVRATLAAAATEAVTVTVGPATSEAFMWSGTTLTIPSGQTQSSSTVTLTATDDETPGVTVDTDPGTPAVVNTAALGVSEDGTMTTDGYTVVLDTDPGGPVTVTVGDDTTTTPGVNDLDKVRVQPGALVFTAGNWNTAQTVTVAGREDDDGVDDTVSLAHAATSADTDYAGLAVAAVAAVAVTVTDNDVPGLTVSTTALAVDEPGTATYSVRLNTEPGGAVTVGIADTTNNADVSTDPSGTGALEFTTASWETAQTVTVTVAADDDAADDTATLAHTVEGTGDTTDYPTTLAAVNVTVTVEDADTAGVTVSETASTLTEEHATDGSGTYTVVLDTQPTAPAPVTVTSDDAAVALDTDATPQTRELTFSSTNWATAQAVTASAAADDDAVDERATITHTLAGAAEYAGSAGPPVVAAVTVALVTVTEDGRETYTVVLTSEPTGPVVVRIGSDNADMDVQPRLLQYTASTWDTAQTVRVQADADDDVQAATATLTHTAAGGDYTGLAAETLAVSVTDSDATNVGRHLVLSRRGLTTEVGATRTYTVGLRVQPAGPVTVTVLSGQTPQAPVTVDTDDSPHNLALVFTAGNWQTAQTVTVTGVTPVDSLNLTHRLDGYGATNQDAARLSVTVAPAGAHLLIDPRVLRVTEGGPSETYTVRLATDPTGSATVTVGTATGSDIGTVSQAPGVLTFTGGATGNWGTAQTVTVTVAADGNTVAGSAAFSHTAGGYSAGQALYLSMTVQEIEDETPTLGAVAAQTYRAGQRVSVRLPGATGGNPPVEHTLTGPLPATTSLTLPDGLTYDAATRRLRGTPATAATAATYTLTATDADGDANTPTRTFAVTVAANPLPGFATWEPRRDPYPLNQAIDPPQQLPAPRNPDGQSLTFFVTPALPTGLTYIPPMREEMEGVTVYLSGGQIVGTPTVRTSQRQYTLTVVDANNNEAEVTFALATGAQPAPADRQPTFGEQTVADQTYTVGTAVTLTLPAATGGDGGLTHTLTGPAGAGPPAGLNCTPPAVEEAHGGTLSGTPAEAQPATPYTLTATDADGDVATLTFRVTIVRVQARVTIADATAEEGTPVQFRVTVSRSLAAPLTLHWTAGRPGSATPGEDYHAIAAGQTTLAAGATAGTLVVRTLDDRRVEPTETFTVTVTLPAETSIELAQDTVEGRIEDDDTEQARKRSLGMVLAGVGRTLATDAVDVIGDRFVRQPSAALATVGGQALDLERTPQRGRWRHAAGVAYGVARALGLEVGSPLAGGDGQFGQVRGAAWSTLTRHLRDPHAPTPPLSALDAPAPLSNASWSPSIPPPSGRG